MVALQLAGRIGHVSHAQQLVCPGWDLCDGTLVAEGLEGEVAVVVARAGGSNATDGAWVEHGVEEAVVDGGTP